MSGFEVSEHFVGVKGLLRGQSSFEMVSPEGSKPQERGQSCIAPGVRATFQKGVKKGVRAFYLYGGVKAV